jgi:chromate reductase, NAD(P)H dehydrogenase (quinone)
MKILALSGSLRQKSYNTAALEALSEIAPKGVEFIFGRIDQLPLFNPDLEGESVPALQLLKSQLATASGLIISSPEYAHGISGSMKNALDWLVGGSEFPSKPIMLINTSPRASHALAALKEVVITMSGNLIESACVSIPLLGSDLDKKGILANSGLCNILRDGLTVFYRQIRYR